jgi:hypothetical protein
MVLMKAIQFQNKRVGSTFLQKAMDSHPEISSIDEIFVNMARKPGMKKSGFAPFLLSEFNGMPETYLRRAIWNKCESNCIFKLMYNQIHYHKGLFQFINSKKFPVIHLMRRKHDFIPITASNLLHHVEQADKLDEQWKEQYKNVKKLELFYEDIIGKKESQFTFMSEDVNIAICNFFEVPNTPMFTDTKKKNKSDIWVYLRNREEVEKVFKGTKYEWMLKEVS